MIRLFVAIDLPETLRARLAALRQPTPRSRWVAPENMHVTLRFIGEVSHGDAADIDGMLSRIAVPAFDLTVAGVGAFGTRGHVRTLWAGVKRTAELARLQGKIETACQRAGQPAEGRKFHPHVTLARCRDIRDDLAQSFLGPHEGFHGGTYRVGEFVLYSSRLGREGPSYRAEARYPLTGDASAADGDDERFADLAAEWAED